MVVGLIISTVRRALKSLDDTNAGQFLYGSPIKRSDLITRAWIINGIEIRNPRFEAGHILYEIVVKCKSGVEWTLNKRYSDMWDLFSELGERDKAKSLTIGVFPSKDLNNKMMYFQAPNEQEIEERRAALQTWWDDLFRTLNPGGKANQNVWKARMEINIFLQTKKHMNIDDIESARNFVICSSCGSTFDKVQGNGKCEICGTEAPRSG